MSETQLTPDGRYVIVRERLWRAVNPNLPADVRTALVQELMMARRQVKTAMHSGQADELATARAKVHAAKIALGERGPVWWQDGAQDFNRYLVKNTPYAAWYRDVVQRDRP